MSVSPRSATWRIRVPSCDHATAGAAPGRSQSQPANRRGAPPPAGAMPVRVPVA